MICAVVLAAGRSERMGTQKLLLPLGDKTVIAHVAAELSRSRVDQILVVVGQDHGPLQVALAGNRVQFAENPDPAGDMLSSIQCGLRALPAACEAGLVVLGDQPGLEHHLVDELLRCWERRLGRIILPACDGRYGHPVLISSQCFQELSNFAGDEGLRGFLNVHAREVYKLGVTALLDDIDTPADYRRQKMLFSSRYADTVWPP